MATDQEKKAAIERLTRRIVLHGKKTRNQINEEAARKIAVQAQKKHQINAGE